MPLARRTRVILGLAALVAALAAWQGAAAGQISVTSATLDGVTSTSAPPGSVIPAQAKASVANTTWRATQVRWGSQSADCVNHDDRGSGSSRTADFNVTAPGSTGSYDVGFAPYQADNCSGTAGGVFTLSNGLRVTPPAPNPNLPPRCGIDVMLVLDKSGSISSSGQTETVRNAARAFLDALSGTGAAVSIVDFNATAGRPVGYTTVTPNSIASVFEPYLVNQYKPTGLTNWEDAFQEVKEANTQGPVADLVVFITDGDPTTYNGAGGRNVGEGAVAAMRPAALEADLVKGQGSHVFAMGVGAAVTTPTSARRLTAISGFDQYPQTNFALADYTLVQDFAQLAQALRQIAIELCQASVTVTKVVDEGDGVYRPDPGWRFTASVSMSAGGYAWLQPAPPPPTGPRSETTNKDGVATFQWKPSNASATSTVTLTEDLKAGYDFVDATCSTSAPGKTPKRTIRRTTPQVGGVTIKPGEYARCTVRNRIRSGTIEIEKSANPQTAQQFGFSGSGPLGDFALVDDGKNDPAAARTFSGLAPGTYTVRELVPDDWELTGVTCTPAAAATIAGPLATINLAPGGAVVCAYRDTRTDPPVPPEPPTPPGPPGPPAPPVPPPVNPFGVAQLSVVKTAPRVARVGDTLQFELTVRNTGPDPARDVIVADVPPAALTLTELRADRRVQLVRGSALWRLGTLASGASRTVRGSVRLQAGTPGLKRNHVLATAVNASQVQNEADTRLLQQRPVTPPVTG